jgi:alpha-L-arabinofuranosidase
VNTGASAQDLSFDLSSAGTVAGGATVVLLTGPRGASNTPAAPRAVVPITSSAVAPSGSAALKYSAPAYSVSVLVLPVKAQAQARGCPDCR